MRTDQLSSISLRGNSTFPDRQRSRGVCCNQFLGSPLIQKPTTGPWRLLQDRNPDRVPVVAAAAQTTSSRSLYRRRPEQRLSIRQEPLHHRISLGDEGLPMSGCSALPNIPRRVNDWCARHLSPTGIQNIVTLGLRLRRSTGSRRLIELTSTIFRRMSVT